MRRLSKGGADAHLSWGPNAGRPGLLGCGGEMAFGADLRLAPTFWGSKPSFPWLFAFSGKSRAERILRVSGSWEHSVSWGRAPCPERSGEVIREVAARGGLKRKARAGGPRWYALPGEFKPSSFS